MCTDGQGPLTRRFHPRTAMVACQAHQAQASAIALLWMRLLDEQSFDQFGR